MFVLWLGLLAGCCILIGFTFHDYLQYNIVVSISRKPQRQLSVAFPFLEVR